MLRTTSYYNHFIDIFLLFNSFLFSIYLISNIFTFIDILFFCRFVGGLNKRSSGSGAPDYNNLVRRFSYVQADEIFTGNSFLHI